MTKNTKANKENKTPIPWVIELKSSSEKLYSGNPNSFFLLELVTWFTVNLLFNIFTSLILLISSGIVSYNLKILKSIYLK